MPTKDEMAKFAKEIHDLVSRTDYNYIEAITAYCKETGLEIEVAATLCNANLKARLESDAMDNNMLKDKGNRLPIWVLLLSHKNNNPTYNKENYYGWFTFRP